MERAVELGQTKNKKLWVHWQKSIAFWWSYQIALQGQWHMRCLTMAMLTKRLQDLVWGEQNKNFVFRGKLLFTVCRWIMRDDNRAHSRGGDLCFSIFISAVPFIFHPPPEFPLGKYLPLFSGLTLTRVSQGDFINQAFQGWKNWNSIIIQIDNHNPLQDLSVQWI